MLDLKKLQENFDSLFETETEDSFNVWLESKKKREILDLLGEGTIEILNFKFDDSLNLTTPQVAYPLHETWNETFGNTQYAMAA